jgi:hypothetical protein
MATEPAERRDLPPRRVEVTVEWHGDGGRLSNSLGRLGTNGRRSLAVASAALVAAAGGLVIAASPSSSPSASSPVLVPRTVKLPCEHSSTPRVFVGVPSRYAALAVHAPKCP